RLLRRSRRVGSGDDPDSKEPERSSSQDRVIRRLGKIWLSLAFSICVFVLPPLLFFMGLVLDRQSEAEWLIGVPIGIAIVIFFVLLPYRFGRGKRGS
ncbi:MAG: hypothetical protein AAGC68_08695, partial [Verrucomicrobiota bacterium]